MMPPATAARKPVANTPYRPHIRIVDAEKGLYTVQSERYTYVLYLVDVARGTCECEAGRRQFQGVKRLGGVCKHLFICRQYHAHRPAAAPSPAPIAAEATRPTPAFTPAPAEFAELFA